MTIREIVLRRVRLPLETPYRLSYLTFEEFEPIVVEAADGNGRLGWGEGHISPGSDAETRESGWRFACEMAEHVVGTSIESAKASIWQRLADSPVAATALATAREMLGRHALLDCPEETRLPLLTPFNALEADAIAVEVEQRLDQGFRTIIVKVGKDVDGDLVRVRAIQQAAAGRATLRLDANRAFTREDGVRFARGLDAQGIELFEQPCAAEDWDANAAVAEASPVPLMLDEPISAIADIERAATIPGIGFCKLKLKRFGGLQRLRAALERVRELGMEPVLGDGLSSEIGCWMEACVARHTIQNAGEFNGFLKPRLRLFSTPLSFEAGFLILPAGFAPEIDRRVLQQQSLETAHVRA